MLIYARVAPKRDTTANWEIHSDFVPLCGELIIYTDKYSYIDEHGRLVTIPAIKIGDGVTRVNDLPFADRGEEPTRYEDLYGLPKINGTTIKGSLSLADLGIENVTPEERARWNNKLNYEVTGELLHLTRD